MDQRKPWQLSGVLASCNAATSDCNAKLCKAASSKAANFGRGSSFNLPSSHTLSKVVLLLIFLCFTPSLLAQSSSSSSDDVDRELFGEKSKEKKADAGSGQGGDELQKQLQRELGTAAVKEDDNPVLDIARRMMDVQSRIAEADAGEQVQDEQKKIIADLDKLIEQAKKSCKGSCSCSNPKQSSSRTPSNSAKKPGSKPGSKPTDKPAKESSQRSPDQKTVKPDPAEVRNLMKDLWGELPPNVREQMMQNPTEQFVPEYESMIEEYYRRLAEGKE